MKEISYLSDGSKLMRFTEQPVVVNRCIPPHPLAGMRYLFTDCLAFKADSDDYWDEVIEGTGRRYYLDDDIQELARRDAYKNNIAYFLVGKKVIFTIPENFDAKKVFTDESYRKSCITYADTYTGPTTSPYLTVINGKVICIKPVSECVRSTSNGTIINYYFETRWYRLRRKKIGDVNILRKTIVRRTPKRSQYSSEPVDVGKYPRKNSFWLTPLHRHYKSIYSKKIFCLSSSNVDFFKEL